MNNRRKRITSYFILFSLLIVLGVIYAILQANLQINGTAKISENRWDVHFDNIIVNPDSVSIGTNDTRATIDPNNDCKVDFEVTLSLPGDFYEFTVDVENEGTIDGMIGTLEKTIKVNNVEVEVPDYLNYTITYVDDTEILENHLLAKNTSETYKIRIEYKSDIENLPDAATISMSVEPVYVQADSGATPIMHTFLYQISQDAMMDNIASTYVSNETGIDFSQVSSNRNGLGIYIRTGTENNPYPIYYYRGAVTNNNVLFGGFCWKIVRTTETGGIKLLYNGTSNNNECSNSEVDTLLLNMSEFDGRYSSFPCNGYMYDISNFALYQKNTASLSTPYKYGHSFTYENNTYTLVDTITSTGDWSVDYSMLNNYHYTCFNTTGTCTNISYIYNTSSSKGASATTLANGESVTDAINRMLISSENAVSSTIKTIIDNWYSTNMTEYSSYLEDTIWCNDRTISSLGGWDPNGGDMQQNLHFNTYDRVYSTYNPKMECERKNDSFTVQETSVGNGLLIYPIGLLTIDEIMLAGGTELRNNSKWDTYYSEGEFWTMSPGLPSAIIYVKDAALRNENVGYGHRIRPSISLKQGIKVTGGDGTSTNPYIVEE